MKRSTCAVCHRRIWWAEVYGVWLHKKPRDAYASSRYFGGGQHEATPPELKRPASSGTVSYHFDDLPIEVGCPVCGATGLKIETEYTTPDPVPMDGGLTIAGQPQPTRYRLVPCLHLLSTWRWERATPDDPVRYTLEPLRPA